MSFLELKSAENGTASIAFFLHTFESQNRSNLENKNQFSHCYAKFSATSMPRETGEVENWLKYFTALSTYELPRVLSVCMFILNQKQEICISQMRNHSWAAVNRVIHDWLDLTWFLCHSHFVTRRARWIEVQFISQKEFQVAPEK